MTIRAHRLVAAGALAVAALAAPIAIALTSGTAAEPSAAPPCLAWYGNKDDGVCLSYSNGSPTNVGTPWGIYGPNNGGITGGSSAGIVSGPLLPGQTWSGPVN